MQPIFFWVAIAAFGLAAVFSGALISGDRARANYHTETSQDRSLRVKAMVLCLGIGAVSGLLAWVLA